MKPFFEKLTALISAFVLVSICMSIGYAEDTDTQAEVNAETFQSTAVNMLKILDIIDEDSAFEPDSSITKGEFIAMLVNLAGISDEMMPDAEGIVFFDVPQEHEYAGYVKTAYELGIITGKEDGNLGVDKPFSYMDAAVMCVRALGGDMIAMQNGGYPTGYFEFASRYGLLKDVNFSGNDIIAKDAAQMIFNALEAGATKAIGPNEYYFDENTTLLDTNFHIKKTEGILDANRDAGIYSNNPLPDGQISIDNYAYYTEDSYRDYLGCKVEAYYREDNLDREIVYIEVLNDAPLEIRAGSVTSYASGTIEYSADGDRRSLKKKISPTAVTLRNWTREIVSGDFAIPTHGTFKLIDQDGDRLYDVVFVFDCKLLYVTDVSSDSLRIYTHTTDMDFRVIDFDEYEEYVVKDTEGNVLANTDITADTVLNVYAKPDKSYIEIIICRETLSTDVAGYSAETENGNSYISFRDSSGKTYRTVAGYEAVSEKNTINVGSSYVFILDSTGFIAAVSAEKKKTDFSFGWLTRIAASDGDSDTQASLKIFTADGVFITVVSANKVIYGSEKSSLTGEQLISKLSKYNNAGTLVRYKLNDSGELKNIELPDNSENAVSGFRKVSSFEDESNKYLSRYDKSLQMFGARVIVDNDTVIFSVPEADAQNGNADVVADEKNYIAYKAGELESYRVYGDNAAGYVVDEGDILSDVIVIKNEGFKGTISSEAPQMLVKGVYYKYSEVDGEAMRMVSGYVAGKEVSYKLIDGIGEDIGEGDIIRLGFRGDEVVGIQRVFNGSIGLALKNDGVTPLDAFSDSETGYGANMDASLVFVYGKVKMIDGDYMKIDALDPQTGEDIVSKNENYFYKASIDAIYRYDKNAGKSEKISLITAADIESIEQNPNSSDRIFIIVNDRRANTIVVYR
ncbi:MAG: S-layer homology domain-containing protein [Clostridia bacterium]|nr:S-layer homology domain-containing protein [Clostridia bacterium]